MSALGLATARGRLVTPLVATAAAIAFAAIPFAVMAADVRVGWGTPLGFFGLFASVVAILAALGSFATFAEAPAARASTSFRALAPSLAATVASFAATVLALRLATGGVLGILGAAIVVPASFLAVVASVFHAGCALGPLAFDELGDPRPLVRRHGFWVIAVGTCLSLPMLGSYGLVDPWETHYGEVAREMLSRDDMISTWWAHEGWFMSKPVLDFWMQALSMASLGVHPEPGAVLTGIAGHVARPEWALRMPVFLLAMIGAYLLYKGVARVFGRSAGLLGALVLMTMPQWFLLGHQSITDMPLVACLSAAMGLLLLGIHTDPGAQAATYEVRIGRFSPRLHAMHLVLGALLLVVVPQVLYLASRNVELQWLASPHGFRPHLDAFTSGSHGNCGLATTAQQSCVSQALVHPRLQPAIQAAAWALLLALVVFLCHAERRAQRIYFLAAWLFAGVATMGKGPAGIVLPAGVALAYIVTTGRWRLLLSLEIAPGLLLLAAMVLPWYVAMYARHGRVFYDELVLRHMLGRTLDHLHDTNEGDDTSFRFYLWQLGYAFFPWTGLVPAALLQWARAREREDVPRERDDASIFFVSWLLLAFGLFTSMGTKFHHYIFPAVPPAAMLLGIWLDRTSRKGNTHDRLVLAGVALAGAILVAAVGRDLVTTGDVVGQARLLHLFTYQYHRAWPEGLDFRPLFAFATAAACALTLALAVPRWRRGATFAFVGAAVAFAAWGLDVYLVKLAPHWGQREVIEAYYRERSSEREPLVAYQMNWKGENFYTGNQLAIFVNSGAPMKTYLEQTLARGTKSVYFVAEHGRVEALRAELVHLEPAAQIAQFDRLTGEGLNNKFCLVRAAFR